MQENPGAEPQPTRARMIFATIVIILVVLCVWKIIDYRTQPPPPPNPIGGTPPPL